MNEKRIAAGPFLVLCIVTALVILGSLWLLRPEPVAYGGTEKVYGAGVAELSEAVAFFEGTDASGAELETLTDGSNADSLHVHTLAAGATDVTSSAGELNKLDGASANVTAANLNTLTGGGNADSLHSHTIAEANCSAGLQDRIPYLTVTGADDGDGTGSATIQAKDAAGNSLAARFRVRTWIANNDYGSPAVKTDFSIATGTELAEVVANADYEAISDATGLVVMNIDLGGAGTVYVLAEADGRLWSSGAINITSP